jgi:hypothetical protein
MYNHAYTLLLNQSDAALAGTTAYPVSPAFSAVDLDADLTAIRTILVAGPITEQVQAVKAIVPILHSPELEPYTLRFDPRVTYLSIPTPTLGELCAQARPEASAAVSSAFSQLSRLAVATRTTTRLFTWDEYQSDLTDLRNLAGQAPEWALRYGAIILAYIYQVERKRRDNV